MVDVCKVNDGQPSKRCQKQQRGYIDFSDGDGSDLNSFDWPFRAVVALPVVIFLPL